MPRASQILSENGGNSDRTAAQVLAGASDKLGTYQFVHNGKVIDVGGLVKMKHLQQVYGGEGQVVKKIPILPQGAKG